MRCAFCEAEPGDNEVCIYDGTPHPWAGKPRIHAVLTAKELSEESRIPVSTLKGYRLNRRNRVVGAEWGPQFFELGRRVLYRRDWVDAWLMERVR